MAGGGAFWQPVATAPSGGGELAEIGAANPTTGSVTFSSIPATYRELVVSIYARSSAAVGTEFVNLRFNGDTAANYDYQRLFAVNSSTGVTETYNQTAGVVGGISGANAGTGNIGVIEIVIPGYARSTFNKAALSTAGNADADNSQIVLNQFITLWASTAAITSLTLLLPSGSFVTGSTITLYGRGTA